MNLAYSSSRVFTDSSTRAWIATALGCFGGDFNIDNGLLLSPSCKMSDILSDKFSGLCMQPRKTRRRSCCEGGSDPAELLSGSSAKKWGPPAQFGDLATYKANHRFVRIRLVARKLGWPLR